MNSVLDIEKLLPAWQALRETAPVLHIETAEDYLQATDFLNQLLDIVRDDAQHPLYSFVCVMGDLIENYENGHEVL